VEPPSRGITAGAEESSSGAGFSKMADMILHDNNCDGNCRASGTAAPVRAALTDAGVNFLAFPGSRLAEPSAGFIR